MPKPPTRLRQNPRTGRLLNFASYAVGVLAFILFFISYEENSLSIWKIGTGLAAIIAMISAFMLHDQGKRHFAPDAMEVLASDGRPPILYLRSFDADETASSDEGILAKILEEAGPFIAIGRPGDELPPLGASRFYVEDAHWREAVARHLDQAALVVLRAGKTHGLMWELRQCYLRLSPERLCVLIPRDRSDYEAFRNSAKQAGLDLKLPAFPEDKLARFKAGELAAILYFDDGWVGSISVFKRAVLKGMSYEIATSQTRASERFRIALQPVADRSGLTIRAPKTNFLAMFVWSYFGLAVVFLFIMMYLLWTGYLE